jgi:hypothetical protein
MQPRVVTDAKIVGCHDTLPAVVGVMMTHATA